MMTDDGSTGQPSAGGNPPRHGRRRPRTTRTHKIEATPATDRSINELMTASGATYSACFGCKVHQADHGMAREMRIELDAALAQADTHLAAALRECSGLAAGHIKRGVQWITEAQRALASAERQSARRHQDLIRASVAAQTAAG